MDSREAELVVEEQAIFFVEAKDYLINVWDHPRQCTATFIQEVENL
jgi:hypothetical protein